MQCKVKGSSLVADVLVSLDAGERLETAAFKIGEGGASRDNHACQRVSTFIQPRKLTLFLFETKSHSKERKLPLKFPVININ